jgi:hypothetical protein
MPAVHNSKEHPVWKHPTKPTTAKKQKTNHRLDIIIIHTVIHIYNTRCNWEATISGCMCCVCARDLACLYNDGLLTDETTQTKNNMRIKMMPVFFCILLLFFKLYTFFVLGFFPIAFFFLFFVNSYWVSCLYFAGRRKKKIRL